MIEVNDLSFTYAGSTKPALKHIDLQIARGEIIGFLGPSGAGKSTAQKILIGLLKSYQGTVTVFGRDLKAWHKDLLQRKRQDHPFSIISVSFAASSSISTRSSLH